MGSPGENINVAMPEASNSNIHGHIHGKLLFVLINTGGVEESENF